jgi:hypothetical protein
MAQQIAIQPVGAVAGEAAHVRLSPSCSRGADGPREVRQETVLINASGTTDRGKLEFRKTSHLNVRR